MLNIALVLALSFIGASASSLGCDGDVLPDGTICDWHDGEIHVSHKNDIYSCQVGCGVSDS